MPRANDQAADEAVVIHHLHRRDQVPVSDRLTLRMEARQIIDALDAARRARPTGIEAQRDTLAAEVERLRGGQRDAYEQGYSQACTLVALAAEAAANSTASKIARVTEGQREHFADRFDSGDVS